MMDFNKLLSPFVGFRTIVDYEIAIYKRHIEKIEALLEDELKEVERRFYESLQHVSSEDEAQYRAEEFGSSEEYWLVKVQLPRIQRQGDLMGVFSFLENRWNNLCDRHALQVDDEREGRNVERKTLKELKGNGLDRAKAYWKEVIGVRFPSESRAWREITSIQKIRNSFVHSEGFIRDYNRPKKKHIENYVNTCDYLLLKGDQIVILNGFISYCLEQFGTFLHELIRILEAKEEDGECSEQSRSAKIN